MLRVKGLQKTWSDSSLQMWMFVVKGAACCETHDTHSWHDNVIDMLIKSNQRQTRDMMCFSFSNVVTVGVYCQVVLQVVRSIQLVADNLRQV